MPPNQTQWTVADSKAFIDSLGWDDFLGLEDAPDVKCYPYSNLPDNGE